MKVPRYNYLAQFEDLPAVADRIRGVLVTGDYILALTALGIGPGDEVITVANTFHATVLAIISVGATPVLVDCEPETYLMDLAALDAACGPRTRAILAVHLFGRSLDMDRLTTIAESHGVTIVEDCAQAVGATWRGQRVGTFGVAAAYSFHPSKNLAAAGDVGAVVTNDPEIARTVRILRGLGQDGQNNHVTLGVNSKLDAIQAIVLDAKLDYLDAWNAEHKRIAHRYADALAHPGITVSPAPLHPGDHVYHLFQVTVPHRNAVLDQLRHDGVDAVVRYPVPIHRQPAFTRYRFNATFPHAEHQAANTLCLPIRPDLSPADVDYVCHSLHTAITTTQEIPA